MHGLDLSIDPPTKHVARIVECEWRDEYRCAYCGGRAATVDHVLPRSRGGADAWLNTVAACGPCNNAKGDRTPREAGMPLRLRPVEPKVRTALLVAVAALDPAMVTSLGLA